MRWNCPVGVNSAARMASEVLPMPPGPSMSAPQVRVFGRKGVGNCLQLVVAPEKGMEAWEVVRDGSARALASSRSAGGVMILGFAFVQGEAF